MPAPCAQKTQMLSCSCSQVPILLGWLLMDPCCMCIAGIMTGCSGFSALMHECAEDSRLHKGLCFKLRARSCPSKHKLHYAMCGTSLLPEFNT